MRKNWYKKTRDYQPRATYAKAVKGEKPLGIVILEGILDKMPININTEYKAIPNRKFRIDYAYVEQKRAVEYEGGIYLSHGGSHRALSTFLKDIEKYNLLAMNGWRLFRVTVKQTEDPEKLENDLITFFS